VTRVLIVDDHPVFRDGLAGLLATLPEVEVTGTADTAEQALAAIRDTAPDVVLMDINLPGASGVEATRRAAQIAPATAMLVITIASQASCGLLDWTTRPRTTTGSKGLSAGVMDSAIRGSPGDQGRPPGLLSIPQDAAPRPYLGLSSGR
jgi:CheY-like chemotaxis protein